MSEGALEVESADVVRVVLQFLQENGLSSSVAALQEESGVSLNATHDIDGLIAHTLGGHWDRVLAAVGHMRLPSPLLSDLYEQVVIELLELREIETARQLLRSAPALLAMKKSHEKRFARLESLTARPFFEPRDAYLDGSSREHRRAHLADALRNEIQAVPPARLLALLGQALKWQQQTGQLTAGARFDLLSGGTAARVVEAETYVTTAGPVIKFGKKCHAECAAFSPDGQFLVSGSIDGFLEVWDYERGKLRKDLAYQEQDNLMMHDEPVLALAFSRDSELLASGSQDGTLKVWRPRTGQCVRRFPKAHSQGITCVAFSRDAMLVATGSFDHLIRVHGLKSGKVLKELRGHASYVNAVECSPDASRLASASSDGTVRVWDARTSECLHEFKPPQEAGADLAVNSVSFLPGSADQLVVCNRSNTIYITATNGNLIKALCSGKAQGGDFVSCVVSPAGGWVHALAEDSHLYAFDVEKGELAHLLKAHDKEVIGLAIHPHRNLIATWSDDSTLRLWRAGSSA